MAHQGLHQSLKQTQSLVLAPQLRQSLKILQVPALELRNTILEELQTNPMLDELPGDGISLEEREQAARDSELGRGEDDSSSNDFDDELPGRNGDREPAVERETERTEDRNELDLSERWGDMLERMDEDSREHWREENGGNSYTSEDAERRKHFFDSLTAEESLQEHLMDQARMSEASESVLHALEYLIGSLDDRGFFTQSLSDVALSGSLPLHEVQEAANLLRSLEPAGIGAVDLRECLLLQLEAHGRGKSLAAQLVREHFELLLRRRIPDLARKSGASRDDVDKALHEIAELDPAPGRRFAEDQNRIVVPDVIVEHDGEKWTVELTNDYIPRLRLNGTYKELIAKGKLSPKEKEYLQEKMRSGRFLISSIEQRQQTIERITRELLKFQRDFFDHGVSKLRPLTMSQVAEAVGVHETTVSRAIANKHMRTPHGLFEFKYFFTPGFQSGDGESVSNKSIKEQIAKLIESENPAKPYSDQEIVNILKEKNIKIARRTVAKYREEMGILATNLRRQYR